MAIPEDLVLDILERVAAAKKLDAYGSVELRKSADRKLGTIRKVKRYVEQAGSRVEGVLRSERVEILRRLVIDFPDLRLEVDSDLWERLKMCKSTLEELSVCFDGDGGDIWSIIYDFPKLSAVTFHQIHIGAGISPLSSFPKLKSATVSAKLTITDVHNLLKAAPLLEHLEVTWVLSNQESEVIIQGDKLKEVIFFGDEAVEVLTLKRCAGLEFVDVSGVKDVKASSICPLLRVVHLQTSRSFTPSKFLSKCPCLRELKLQSYDRDYDFVVEIKSSSLRRLLCRMDRFVLTLNCAALEELTIVGDCLLEVVHANITNLKLMGLWATQEWTHKVANRSVKLPFLTQNLDIRFVITKERQLLSMIRGSSLRTITLTVDRMDAYRVETLAAKAFNLSPRLQKISFNPIEGKTIEPGNQCLTTLRRIWNRALEERYYYCVEEGNGIDFYRRIPLNRGSKL